MTFSHSQRNDVIQRFALSLTTYQPVALLFGEVWNKPKKRKDRYSFNLRLTRADKTGLHIIAPDPIGSQIAQGDFIMVLAEMYPRRRGKGPNPIFHVVFLAVSEN